MLGNADDLRRCCFSLTNIRSCGRTLRGGLCFVQVIVLLEKLRSFHLSQSSQVPAPLESHIAPRRGHRNHGKNQEQGSEQEQDSEYPFPGSPQEICQPTETARSIAPKKCTLTPVFDPPQNRPRGRRTPCGLPEKWTLTPVFGLPLRAA